MKPFKKPKPPPTNPQIIKAKKPKSLELEKFFTNKLATTLHRPTTPSTERSILPIIRIKARESEVITSKEAKSRILNKLERVKKRGFNKLKNITKMIKASKEGFVSIPLNQVFSLSDKMAVLLSTSLLFPLKKFSPENLLRAK